MLSPLSYYLPKSLLSSDKSTIDIQLLPSPLRLSLLRLQLLPLKLQLLLQLLLQYLLLALMILMFLQPLLLPFPQQFYLPPFPLIPLYYFSLFLCYHH